MNEGGVLNFSGLGNMVAEKQGILLSEDIADVSRSFRIESREKLN